MEKELLYDIFGVSKSYRSTKTEVRHGGVFIAVEPLDKRLFCPHCKSRNVIRKGKRMRRLHTLPIGFHPVYLDVSIPRCQCNGCGLAFEITPPFARTTRTTPKR